MIIITGQHSETLFAKRDISAEERLDFLIGKKARTKKGFTYTITNVVGDNVLLDKKIIKNINELEIV